MSRAKPPSIEEFEKQDNLADRAQSEIRLLRAENRALRNASGTQDKIIAYAKLALDALGPVPIPAARKTTERGRKKTRESVVLGCACWHVGEEILSSEMAGINEYDFDIFCRRLQAIVDKTIRFTQENMQGYQFDDLWILHLGDFVSGEIHELAESNCLNIVEQVHLGALVTAQALMEFARVFPRVHFVGVVGNHGRTKAKPYSKGKQQINWDYIAYNYLKLLLVRQKNITFDIPLSPWHEVTINGHRFHIQHGDSIKGWASVPFYGLAKDSAKWTEIATAQGRSIRYFVRSHFHTKASIQTSIGENILIASLKGACEYGANFGFHHPIQTLFGVHEKYGKTWELPLNVQNVDPAKSRYKYRRDISLSSQVDDIFGEE